MSDRSTNPKNNNDINESASNNPNNNNDNNDKQHDAAPGAAHDFRQNHTRPLASNASETGFKRPLPPPLPHELTAEWTVRAQLTFARAGERVQREFSTNDPVNPVRVVYKWSTLDSTSENVQDGGIVILDDDVDNDEEDNTSSTTLLSNKRPSSGRCSGQSTPLKRTSIKHTQQQQQSQRQHQRHESFRSTTSSANADLGGGDSAFSSSNTSKKSAHKDKTELGGSVAGSYGTRCRSTCNIVVSAVADFLPVDVAAAAPSNDNFMTVNSSKTTNPTTATTSDFTPADEPDPFVYNTTACYTVLPEKSFDDCASNASKNFASFGKILALRDAFSQTSDTETKYFEEKGRFSNSRSPIDRRTNLDDIQRRNLFHQRKPYEHRRATTEALLQPTSTSAAPSVDEGDTHMPSCTPSPKQTFKSASLPRIPPLPGHQYPATIPTYHQKQHQQQKLQPSKSNNSLEPQKKPRTVHIDVYCTGSDDDDEDQADGELSSSSSRNDEADAGNRQELESNSTPQTVLDNEQMFLRHQRVTGSKLPRRIAQHQPLQKTSTQQKASANTTGQTDLNLGHAITKSSTAEEVSESKQLLFRKHIGDQRAAKLQNLRQKYMRQPSDDALSSNYPNSSRSTIRDATCSSISSAVPSTHTADYGDSSWKETDEHDDLNAMCTLAKSESFEYENSVDRLRIKQMERFWSNRGAVSTDDSVPGHMHPTALQSIAEGNSHRNSPFTAAAPFQRNDTLPSESENYSETDIFYTYPGPGRHMQPNAIAMQLSPTPSQQEEQLHQTPHFMRNRPGFLQFFGPPTPSPEPIPQTSSTINPPTSAPVISSQAHLLYPKYSQHLQRWKSETRDNLSDQTVSPSAISSLRSSPQPAYMSTSTTPQRCGSEAPPSSTTLSSVMQSPLVSRRFDMKQESPAVSEASTVVLGYTSEYLEKARKFGKVVGTTRKPGHHVGPTKNPNCLCESCQRWMSERFQLRSRAFSLGERPVLKRPT